jgi:hypothetical protein
MEDIFSFQSIFLFYFIFYFFGSTEV